MKLKKIFLLIFLSVCFCPRLEAQISKVYFENIRKMTEENYNLGKQIISKLRFEIYPEQFFQMGTHPKYVLAGSDGKLYMFKIYRNKGEGNIPNSVLAVKYSSFFGLSAVDCYDLWLPINGKLVYGIIEEIKLHDINGYHFKRLPIPRIPAQNNWLCYYLFRWFIGNSDLDFWLSAKGELINIDMDTLLDTKYIDFRTCDELNDGKLSEVIKLSLQENNFAEYYGETLSFIKYLEAVPAEVITRLGRGLVYQEKIKLLLKRKQNLRKEYERYLGQIMAGMKIPAHLSGQPEDEYSYARRIIDGLRQKIASKREALKSLPAKLQPRESINIIAYDSNITEYGLSQIPIGNLLEAAKNINEALKCLRENTMNIYDKLALSLYLNRNEQNYPWYGYGVLPLDEIRFIIPPVSLDPRVVAANLLLGMSRNYSLKRNKSVGKYGQYSINDLSDLLENRLQSQNKDEWDYLFYGNCYLADPEVVLALKEYQKIITLKGADKQAVFLAHMHMGYIYELNNEWLRFGAGCDLDQAGDEFKQAIKVDPRSILAHLNLLVIYLQKEDFSQAKHELKQLAGLDSSWRQKKEEIRCLVKGDLEGLRFALLDEEGHYVMSLVYIIKGDYGFALEHLKEIKNPADREFLLNAINQGRANQ